MSGENNELESKGKLKAEIGDDYALLALNYVTSVLLKG